MLTLVQTRARPWSVFPPLFRAGPSISGQFLIVAAIVLFVTMAVLATWVNEQIKHSVLQTSSAQGAAFMTGFLEPHVQELEPGGDLGAAERQQLDTLFIGTPLGRSIISIKIWRADGTVLYATTPGLIGQHFVSTDVTRAAAGEIVAEYEDLISLESAYEQTLDVALIEVYGPLYRTGTNEVVAVGEIYENADALAAELSTSRIITWAVVGATTVFMLAVLYAIVRRGGATIARQREELRQRYDEARQLAEQNQNLREIADKARLDASEANEQFLGRIGSDIHDGPIQLLTLAMLKLTTIVRSMKGLVTMPRPADDEIESTIGITDGALVELRNISSGLSLPEIGELGLQETIALAIFRHQDLTGETVTLDSHSLPAQVGEAVKICAYRVVQESLTNSHKHAPGAAQSVCVSSSGNALTIVVADTGPGMASEDSADAKHPRLGLSGIRNRVGALKGTVAVTSNGANGTRVAVVLPLEQPAPAAV